MITMIKKTYLVSAFLMMMAVQAEAALFDRGEGMIYDDALDITWLQDANYAYTSGYELANEGKMTWDESVIWADQLTYGGFDGWTLPDLSSLMDNASISFDGISSDWGYNITDIDSPLSYMYYVNLGNIGSRDVDGGYVAPELYGLNSTSFANGGDETDMVSFTNLFSWYYWYDEPYVKEGQVDKSWTFKFDSGVQGSPPVGGGTAHAWAVHAGDIAAVPVPAAVWLFVSGLLGLVGVARRKEL